MSAIRIELELKDGSFVSGMLRAGQSISSFQKELARLDPHFRELSKNGENVVRSFTRVDGQTRTLLGTMRDVSIVASAVGLAFNTLTGASDSIIGNIIRVNAEFQRLRFQMEGMSDAADPVKDAADQVERLRDMATQAPFSIRELNSAFVKLKASGIEDVDKTMQGLVDGIAAFGGSDEQLHRVTLGITQMAGKGVIQMEEMRQQLGESMPTAMRLMARSMGVSVAELVDAISTGKVEARAAIAGFTEELERAYGGSAIRMMQTFSGQVTQMKANLQTLASADGGGLNNFFNELTGHLQDFNDFLASPEAKSAADAFGNTLSAIADAAVWTGKALYGLREELLMLAKFAGAALVFKSLLGGLKMFGMQLVVARGQMQSFFSALQSGTAMSAGASGFGMLSTGASAAANGLSAARFAAMGFFGTLSTLAPYLAVAATGVMWLADKFGILGSSTEDAYESLKKYGAETRKQANETIDARKEEIQARIDEIENGWLGTFDRRQRKQRRADLQPELDALKRELAGIEEERLRFLEEVDEREIEMESRKLDRKLETASAKASQEYNQRQNELDDKYQLERSAAAKAGVDVAEIDKKYREQTTENEKKLLQARIQIMDDEVKAIEAKIKEANDAKYEGYEDDARIYEALKQRVLGQKLDFVQQLNNLKQLGRSFGIEMLETPEDSTKKFEDGQQQLEKLKEDIQGLEADIKGASGEYAKLEARIARGDYGSIEDGGDAVRELHEELREAVKQKEALDDIMKGRQDLDSDIKSLEAKVRSDQLKLEARIAGKDLNEAEQILAKIKAGFYEGIGPIENIRAAIANLGSVTNSQGLIAQETARIMREQTFGETMLAQVERLKQAILGVGGALQQLGVIGSNINIGAGFAGGANFANVDGGILDLIAQRESGGDYNATLDNGLWTGGPQNLVGMTLNQVRALQQQMLANPANRAKYGNGLGSSALGRYQIVGKTLQGLIEEMGLTGNELFDKNMQDAMAKRLLARRGRDPQGLRNEWEGLKGVSDAAILAAWDRSATGTSASGAGRGPAGALPSVAVSGTASLPGFTSAPMNTSFAADMEQSQITYTEEATKKVEELAAELERIEKANKNLDLSDEMKRLKDEAANANRPVEELGKNYQAMLDKIKAGEFGDSTDPADYAELLKLAQELDQIEKTRDDRKKAREDSDRQMTELERERAQLQKDIAEAQARAKDPDYLGAADDLSRLNEQMDEYLANIETAFGKDSQEYRDALAYKQSYLSDAQALQRATIQADLAEQRRDLEDSLLSESDLRQTQMQRDLAIIDQRAEQMRAAGMSEVEITEETERMKALIRQKYAQEGMTPMQNQMKEWGKLQDNLQQASARWMDSAASGIAGLLTGTGDLRSAVNGIISDLANIGVRYFMSGLMPGTGKGTSMKTPGGVGTGTGLLGKGGTAAKMAVGVKHTGGIVGRGGGSMRMANAAVFAGAKRFHTGGMVGKGNLGLRKGEVPIIAKEGEGVFTPEQMRALGGARSGGGMDVTISAPVSVNASGGTFEQNNDLAKQISREMENTMRTVVIEEMRKQIRPGNMMNTRSR